MTVQDPQAAAMLDHIVSQVQSNIEFLVSQNYISRVEANQFLTKLPSQSTANGLQPTVRAPSFPTPASVAPAHRSVPGPQTPQAVKARAIWGYNQDNAVSLPTRHALQAPSHDFLQDPNDLTFAAGDLVEIVEETNDDWWVGRLKGKQGLFPSNYVEKISATVPAPAAEKPAYRPFGAAYHGMDTPPQPGQGVNSVGLQEQDNSQKKSKYGNLKNTVCYPLHKLVSLVDQPSIDGTVSRWRCRLWSR